MSRLVGKYPQILALMLLATPAVGQTVDQGQKIARQWCSGCHQVEPQAQPRSDVVPSFASVAQMTSTTSISLAAFLSSSHRNMPDYSLTPGEIRDVSAYILSLRIPEKP